MACILLVAQGRMDVRACVELVGLDKALSTSQQ